MTPRLSKEAKELVARSHVAYPDETARVRRFDDNLEFLRKRIEELEWKAWKLAICFAILGISLVLLTISAGVRIERMEKKATVEVVQP